METEGVGFILNEKYNLQHAVTSIGYGMGVGVIVYSYIFARIINTFRQVEVRKIHKIFFLIMVMQSLLFYFTGFEFFKTKMWFNLFIAFFFFVVMMRKRNHFTVSAVR